MISKLTVERCREVVETFSEEFARAIADKSSECLHNYLLMYPEPKNYAELWNLGHAMTDAVLLFLVAEGYLEVVPKYLATDEEKAKRKEKSGKDGPFTLEGMKIPKPSNPGQYL